jgi:DNA-binding transcriptional ArsR family regulator
MTGPTFGEPANRVSYHLRRLRDQALVRERRSAADGRDVNYSVDLEGGLKAWRFVPNRWKLLGALLCVAGALRLSMPLGVAGSPAAREPRSARSAKDSTPHC